MFNFLKDIPYLRYWKSLKKTVNLRKACQFQQKSAEIGTVFPQYSSKGLLGIPYGKPLFGEKMILLFTKSIAQPKSGGRAAEKLEVIPKLWRGRLPWDTQEPLK